VGPEEKLVLAQAQDLLVLVEGLRVVQSRQGLVQDWVLALERALARALELVVVVPLGLVEREALVEVLEPREK
jgi:hypothetical protein